MGALNLGSTICLHRRYTVNVLSQVCDATAFESVSVGSGSLVCVLVQFRLEGGNSPVGR